jgi:hypothetical protein
MRAAVVSVLVFSTVTLAAAASAPAQRYTHPRHPFAIQIPPSYSEVEPPPAALLGQWVDHEQRVSLSVAYVAVDTSAWRSSPMARFLMPMAMEAGMRVATKRFKRIASRTFEYRQLPALEMEYEFERDEGTKVHALGRYYFTGDGQYSVTVMGSIEAFAATRGEFATLLDSFELKAQWRSLRERLRILRFAPVAGLLLAGIVALSVYLVVRSGRPPRPRRAGR